MGQDDKQMSDEEIASLLAIDLDKHFGLFVAKYEANLQMIAYHFIGDSQDAEEIVQDVFFHTYRALAKRSTHEVQTMKLRPWLKTCVRRGAINHMRNQEQAESLHGPQVQALIETLECDWNRNPEEEAIAQETYHDLYQKIVSLPVTDQLLLVLYYFLGLQYKELATIFDVSPNTLKSRGRRAVQKLEGMYTLQQEEVK